MPCTSLQTKLASACSSGIGAVRSRIRLLKIIAQNMCEASLVDPYAGLLVYTRQGLGTTTVVGPVGAYNLTFGANPVTEIHCHDCPLITGITCTSTVLTVVDLKAVPAMTTLDFSGCSALPTLDLTTAAVTAMVKLVTQNCSSLTTITAPTITSFSSELRVGPATALTSFNFAALTSTPVIVLGGSPSLTSIYFPALTTTGYFNFNSNTALQSVNCPELLSASVVFEGTNLTNLSSVSAPKLASAGTVGFSDSNVLTSISLPLLSSCAGVTFYNNAALATISLPSLSSCDTFIFAECPSLTTFSADSLGSVYFFSGFNCTSLASLVLPNLDLTAYPCEYFGVSGCSNLSTIFFSSSLPEMEFYANGCDLSESTVDFILQSGIDGGITSSGLYLDGGTSSPPSAAGAVNKATLITNGNTVVTN